ACAAARGVPQVPVLCLVVGEQMLGMDVFGALAGPARQPDGQTLGLRVGPDDGSEAEPAQAARHHAPNLIVTWIGRTALPSRRSIGERTRCPGTGASAVAVMPAASRTRSQSRQRNGRSLRPARADRSLISRASRARNAGAQGDARSTPR